MRNLPEEVILEILLWLPVKSLLRFRCVSKSWLSLISNPQFAKSHFERSSIHTDKLIYIAVNEARSIDFEGSFHDDSSVVNLNFPITAPSCRIHIMGSCRGFLLLDDAEKLFVWNPSTGLCKTLSYSSMSSELYPFIYGFGYDSSTDDYLVVLASYDVDSGSANIVTRFEFFSLRNNSWKEIGGTHFSFMNAVDDPKGGVLLNGVVHWLVYDPNALTAVVLAFNLIGKNLREVPMPDDFDYNLEFCDFGVLGGCLSLSIVDESTTEIWIMQEYEVKSSWSKSITISLEEIGTDYFSPICFTNGGEIVGTTGSTGLIKFSREGELLEQCAHCHDELGCEVAVYTQSLLLLPSDSEEEGEDKQH